MSPRAQRVLNEAVLKAIGACLEGLPVDALELLGRRGVRKLVLLYVHEFAVSHGVVLSDEDILDSLDAHVHTRRSSNEITAADPTARVARTEEQP